MDKWGRMTISNFFILAFHLLCFQLREASVELLAIVLVEHYFERLQGKPRLYPAYGAINCSLQYYCLVWTLRITEMEKSTQIQTTNLLHQTSNTVVTNSYRVISLGPFYHINISLSQSILSTMYGWLWIRYCDDLIQTTSQTNGKDNFIGWWSKKSVNHIAPLSSSL